MAQIIKKTAVACGLIGALAIGAAAPSLAQFVVIVPHGPYYGGPYGHYAGPYGYRFSRFWDYPAGYDTSGAPYYHSQLGWHPLGPVGANPCYPGLRAQNRC
jgi:hypothetical protein